MAKKKARREMSQPQQPTESMVAKKRMARDDLAAPPAKNKKTKLMIGALELFLGDDESGDDDYDAVSGEQSNQDSSTESSMEEESDASLSISAESSEPESSSSEEEVFVQQEEAYSLESVESDDEESSDEVEETDDDEEESSSDESAPQFTNSQIQAARYRLLYNHEHGGLSEGERRAYELVVNESRYGPVSDETYYTLSEAQRYSLFRDYAEVLLAHVLPRDIKSQDVHRLTEILEFAPAKAA
jgi:hypothetical protein